MKNVLFHPYAPVSRGIFFAPMVWWREWLRRSEERSSRAGNARPSFLEL